ncbi:hypothetical protein [Streptomyces lydicus]
MDIPSEPIGSIPRSPEHLAALANHQSGQLSDAEYREVCLRAVQETVQSLEAAGEQVVTDGEQSKPSAYTYPIAGADSLASEGVVIPYADGHHRQLPFLTVGPFRYRTTTGQYLQNREAVRDGPGEAGRGHPVHDEPVVPAVRHRRIRT